MIGPPSELAGDVVMILAHMTDVILWRVTNLCIALRSFELRKEKAKTFETSIQMLYNDLMKKWK